MRIIAFFCITLGIISCGGGDGYKPSLDAPLSANGGSTQDASPQGTPQHDTAVSNPTKLDTAGPDTNTADTKLVDANVPETKHTDTKIIDASHPDLRLEDAKNPDTSTDGESFVCAIGQTCITDTECPSGLTCQFFDEYNENETATKMCAPPECVSCSPQTCVVNVDKRCNFFACESRDGGVAPDSNTKTPDGGTTDTNKPDTAPPLPMSERIPSATIGCQNFPSTSCGGDLSGSWKIIGDCDPWLSETELLATLNKKCATLADTFSSGTAQFNADGTCKFDRKTNYSTSYSASCLTTQQNDTCSAKNTRIAQEIGTKNIISASCALNGTESCVCENAFDEQADTCVYSMSGNKILFATQPATLASSSYGYCVTGDTLTFFVGSDSATCPGCRAGIVMTRVTN